MANVVLHTYMKSVPATYGKVRDLFDLGDKLLVVASDRLRGFDVGITSGIPYKGIILTKVSRFWYNHLSHVVAHDFISDEILSISAPFCDCTDQLAGRTMLVKKAAVLPVQCVVRGHLAGSVWKEYRANGTVDGIALRKGLKLCEKLPEPVLAPVAKSRTDDQAEKISFGQCVDIIGEYMAWYLRDKSIEAFVQASAYAESKGIIIADTKFKWGIFDGAPIMIGEVLTPDSSLFWAAEEYEPGRNQVSFDKQFVCEYLAEMKCDRSDQEVDLPEGVIEKTSERYIAVYERLIGMQFESSAYDRN